MEKDFNFSVLDFIIRPLVCLFGFSFLFMWELLRALFIVFLAGLIIFGLINFTIETIFILVMVAIYAKTYS